MFNDRTVNANFIGSTVDAQPAMRLALREGRLLSAYSGSSQAL